MIFFMLTLKLILFDSTRETEKISIFCFCPNILENNYFLASNGALFEKMVVIFQNIRVKLKNYTFSNSLIEANQYSQNIQRKTNKYRKNSNKDKQLE